MLVSVHFFKIFKILTKCTLTDMQILDYYKLSRNRMLVSVQFVRIEKMYTYKNAGSRS